MVKRRAVAPPVVDVFLRDHPALIGQLRELVEDLVLLALEQAHEDHERNRRPWTAPVSSSARSASSRSARRGRRSSSRLAGVCAFAIPPLRRQSPGSPVDRAVERPACLLPDEERPGPRASGDTARGRAGFPRFDRGATRRVGRTGAARSAREGAPLRPRCSGRRARARRRSGWSGWRARAPGERRRRRGRRHRRSTSRRACRSAVSGRARTITSVDGASIQWASSINDHERQLGGDPLERGGDVGGKLGLLRLVAAAERVDPDLRRRLTPSAASLPITGISSTSSGATWLRPGRARASPGRRADRRS